MSNDYLTNILQLANLSTEYMQYFILTLTRVSAILMTAPVFEGRSIPNAVKIVLAVFLSMILLPLNTQGLAIISEDVWGLALALGREVVLGAMIGFVTGLVFTAMKMAANLIGNQMGFSFASTVDPLNHSQSSVLDQMFNVLAMLAFLAINGHHYLIMAMQRTFAIVPLNTFVFSGAMAEKLIQLTGQMFVISVKMAFPVLAALLLADIALGIIARVVPQLNVFFVGMPLKIVLGIVTIVLALPMTLGMVEQLLHGAMNDVLVLLKTVG